MTQTDAATDETDDRWSVAIFTSREDATVLGRTVDAVLVAAAGHRSTIDVLVDGNPVTAEAIATQWQPQRALGAGSSVRVWLVPWRDKACTWNRYVDEIAPAAGIAFFVDGYVRPAPDSLARLAGALSASRQAWAASGVPTVGPSAVRQRRDLLSDGGLHGNLYALGGDFLRLLKLRGFRLPTGLYRNDSLIGAIACFAADPKRHTWDRARIAVVEGATWDNDVVPIGSVRGLRGYWKRRERQAQGMLEIAAMREHMAVGRLPPEQLPRTAAELVRMAPDRAMNGRGPVDRLLIRRAAKRLAAPVTGSAPDGPARLLRVWNES